MYPSASVSFRWAIGSAMRLFSVLWVWSMSMEVVPVRVPGRFDGPARGTSRGHYRGAMDAFSTGKCAVRPEEGKKLLQQ
jgi:hypothetical protein